LNIDLGAGDEGKGGIFRKAIGRRGSDLKNPAPAGLEVVVKSFTPIKKKEPGKTGSPEGFRRG
jgi:hypothetical protein